MASMHIAEADWKRLRKLKEVALDRLCAAILHECRDITVAEGQTTHERYLALFRHIRERDADVANAFDGLSRSTAVQRLAAMCALDLVAEEELAEFSPDTQRSVRSLLELLYRRPTGRRLTLVAGDEGPV